MSDAFGKGFTVKIGVLALQGSFREHLLMLQRLDLAAVEVRLPADLTDLDGLIIPGGESTTIGKLAVEFELMAPLRRFAAKKAVWGTCAGMILLAKSVAGRQPLLGAMDITVDRNAFGSQIHSFQTDLTVEELKNGAERPFPSIFIRAPKIRAVAADTRILARLADGSIVAAIQNRCLATAFHPELTDDTRFHRFFVAACVKPSPV